MVTLLQEAVVLAYSLDSVGFLKDERPFSDPQKQYSPQCYRRYSAQRLKETSHELRCRLGRFVQDRRIDSKD